MQLELARDQLPDKKATQEIREYSAYGRRWRGDAARLIYILDQLPPGSRVSKTDLDLRIYGWSNDTNASWLSVLVSKTRKPLTQSAGLTISYDRGDPRSVPPEPSGYYLEPTLTLVQVDNLDAALVASALDSLRYPPDQLENLRMNPLDVNVAQTLAERIPEERPKTPQELTQLRGRALARIWNILTTHPDSTTKDEYIDELLRYLKSAGVNFPVLAQLISPGFHPAEAQEAKLPSLHRPGSPPLPHDDLRNEDLRKDPEISRLLIILIDKFISDLPDHPNKRNELKLLATKIIPLLPEHLIYYDPGAISADPRDLTEIGIGIIDLTQLVYDAQHGELHFGKEEEVAETSPNQYDNIANHLRALLAHYLILELPQTLNEKELSQNVLAFSKNVRAIATLITRDNDMLQAYETVSTVISNLPALEGPMICARMSTRLYKDLGLPCMGYTGESRIAEILRDIGATALKGKGEFVLSTNKRNLNIISEELAERVVEGKIDTSRIFTFLENQSYSDILIKSLLETCDSVQRDIIIQALRDSGCFKDLVRELEKAPKITEEEAEVLLTELLGRKK